MKRSIKHILATSVLLFAGINFAASDDIVVVNNSKIPQYVVLAYTASNHSMIVPTPQKDYEGMPTSVTIQPKKSHSFKRLGRIYGYDRDIIATSNQKHMQFFLSRSLSMSENNSEHLNVGALQFVNQASIEPDGSIKKIG